MKGRGFRIWQSQVGWAISFCSIPLLAQCGSQTELIAIIRVRILKYLVARNVIENRHEAHNIERLLRYIGEPLEPPKRAPARDPPYFKTQVLRRKFGELN